jgi:hypothetical protein
MRGAVSKDKGLATLHDRYGKKLLGFDNAHPIKTTKRGRFTGRCIAYDHRHMNPGDKGAPSLLSHLIITNVR